ncbi:MAG: ThiF family adenylyltransferase [Mangrovibacterium sp.]
MKNWLDRTSLMLGDEKLNKLKTSHILVIGLGGVGAYAAELICRAGVGEMTIVDGDVVDVTNRNRQLPALISNIGKPKAEVLAARFLDINPDLNLHVINEYLQEEQLISVLEKTKYDYVVDAIDTLAPKVSLIQQCVLKNLPVVSSMGAGGKFNPMDVRTSDIKKSFNCRLAKQLRKRLHRLGITTGITVVFSPEEVDPSRVRIEESLNKKSAVGTISYMPPLFGCHVAAAVIRAIVGE